jgi:hypothetical protein
LLATEAFDFAGDPFAFSGAITGIANAGSR